MGRDQRRPRQRTGPCQLGHTGTVTASERVQGHLLPHHRELTPAGQPEVTLRADEAQDKPGGPRGPQGAESCPQAALASGAAGPGCEHPWPAAPNSSSSEQCPRPWGPDKKQPLEPAGQVRG